MIKNEIIISIRNNYGRKSNRLDLLEYKAKEYRESLFGVNYGIFDNTINYYHEVFGEIISYKEALGIALDKDKYRNDWFEKERSTLEEKMNFYKETRFYAFRNPYYHRLGGYRWIRKLGNHFEKPSILEYGCGSAAITEYLSKKYPECDYTVADIPSVSLDFVKWKKQAYGFPYNILEIGVGKEGIPLKKEYDLIICKEVLEHTPNPFEIITSFVEHLSHGGVLLLDFINAPGAENLIEAVQERDSVKDYLKAHLIPVKAIDEPKGNDGLYVQGS